MSLPLNQIVCGDCLDVLKGFPNNSIDLVVTDPPYGYSFMGKEWDKAVPTVEVWQECLRVLKAGAFAFVMSSPRQDVLSQMIVRLRQAGFNTAFTSIYWTYASGFPKPINISKFMDKKFGVEMPVGKSFTVAGKYSEKVGDPTPQGEERDKMRHEPTTIQAKSFNGSYGGFQPKPAVEIIIVCMKPLSEKTFVDQALANGKGVTWLDKCRVPYISQEEQNSATPQGKCTSKEISAIGAEPDAGRELERVEFDRPEQRGRFPANLLVSDDVLNDGKITTSEGGKTTRTKESKTEKWGYEEFHMQGYGDSGSFSRYFDLDKWFDKTIENLSEGVRKTFPFLICPKASKSERNKGLENIEEQEVFRAGHGNEEEDEVTKRFRTKMKNFHPTVKPLKLISYLVTLGSRPKDVVLDPFSGSGTTCLAAKILERQWIDIDINSEYCKIACARLGVPTFATGKTLVTTVTQVTPVAATPKGTCSYAGKCVFKTAEGNCANKRFCKEKS